MASSESDERATRIVDAAAGIVGLTRKNRPLVTHLTNIVVANDQANITLAVGGSPLMSLSEEEQDDLLAISTSLLINIGTIHAAQRKVIAKAAKAATKRIPLILDPVGVAATTYRRQVVEDVLSATQPAVIKGNAGEIAFLAGKDASLARGLDSNTADSTSASQLVISLAKRYNTVVILHGPVDYISDGTTVVELSNGSPRLAEITGTGCSLGSVVAAYVGAVVGEGREGRWDVLLASVAA
ncbi:hydroxyethylthiazole kinase [Cryptococcus sp. DSM 104549]